MKITIIGASGYVGGELMRLALMHPHVDEVIPISSSHAGKKVSIAHPHLRQVKLRFLPFESAKESDVVFSTLPHGKSAHHAEEFLNLGRIIDLSADFRLHNPDDYERWYGFKHPHPEFLDNVVYGLPELHRKEIRTAEFVAVPGCIATSVILALHPLRTLIDSVIIDAKIGSSASGKSPTLATHHPERNGVVRCYKPVLHRHLAEITQELEISASMTTHAIELVRGISSTCHVLLKRSNLSEKEIWKQYRDAYYDEPFIRIIKQRSGNYRFPEPKILSGTNFCDVGFALDPTSPRVVVISALDNLMKGAAGQAIQCMNIMFGFNETEGLNFLGLHPI